MDALTTVLALLGLVLLVVGAEMLVRGSSSLAARVGLSPLVIGLTIVAFGTSSPELAVSVGSALSGEAEIAVGNVVGSNIFNVLFILGLSALIVPLTVSNQLVRLDVPIMIVVSVLVLALAWDGEVGRGDGGILVVGVVLYTVFAICQSRQETRREGTGDEAAVAPETPAANRQRSLMVHLGLIVGGLALLVLGARWLVDGAVELARTIGVSELVVGLTIVAAGTSLPEVATSIVAALRNERDIAVGNVVGSCLYNLLAILGLTSILSPNALVVAPGMLNFDIPVMIAVAIACLPIFFTGQLIGRWEGGLFLGYYVAYIAYLILDTTGHDTLSAYSTIMLSFVLPLTALTLAALAFQAARRTGRSLS